MDPRIRPADESDLPDIIAIWKEFMELLDHANPDYWKARNGQQAFGRHLENVLADNNVLLAIAEGNGDVVGFSLAYVEALPEWFGGDQIGLIRYLAISEGSRGEGIGHQLVNFVINWFRSRGVNRIELYVLKGLRAAKFWRQLGFKEFMHRSFLEI